MFLQKQLLPSGWNGQWPKDVIAVHVDGTRPFDLKTLKRFSDIT